MERWLKIHEFPRYSISDKGRVRNDLTDRIMVLVKNPAGVLVAYLVRDGRQYARGVAKLVADHFLPHSTDLFNTPLHLDGDRMNNAVENLMWRPRWLAISYLQQFEEHRPPYVNCPILEIQTERVFDNSWDAATTLGLMENDIAHSFHAYQGAGERRSVLGIYYFQKA